MTTLDQLLDALAAATPKLDGARCRNLWAAFDPPESGEDPEDVRYRHRAALALCESCPALTPCGAWIASLEPRQRPLGVIAGQVNDGRRGRRTAA
ncbi:hypothetical protein [Mycolicibacterium sp.]|uniref:hypothetical protein n=1 Tax=Mycolicibacterium sp. TaxID=2320850 RepID=UPI001DFB14C2|nr:hypothetical protein [Mycolicibacterium sp.]MCB1290352.1 hypothetical protein [Mycobacterium sp.]MCB9408321.1 hypothetical protein [Mycolicibacterium sp.]